MKKARIIFLSVAIVAFVLDLILIFVSVYSTGKDYTEAYAIHNEISTLSSVTETVDHLTENKISYSLSNNTLSLDKYDVSYTIKNDKLIPCTKLTRLAKLDNENETDLVIETYDSNGEYTRRVSFEKGLSEYYKVNDNYYIKLSGLFDIVGHILSITTGVCTVQFVILKKES